VDPRALVAPKDLEAPKEARALEAPKEARALEVPKEARALVDLE